MSVYVVGVIEVIQSILLYFALCTKICKSVRTSWQKMWKWPSHKTDILKESKYLLRNKWILYRSWNERNWLWHWDEMTGVLLHLFLWYMRDAQINLLGFVTWFCHNFLNLILFVLFQTLVAVTTKPVWQKAWSIKSPWTWWNSPHRGRCPKVHLSQSNGGWVQSPDSRTTF